MTFAYFQNSIPTHAGGLNPEAQANNNLLNTFRVGALTAGGGEVSLPVQDGIVDFFGGLDKFTSGTPTPPVSIPIISNSGGGHQGRTHRVLIQPASNASNIRISIKGPNANKIIVDAVAICERSTVQGADGNFGNCIATPVSLSFGSTPFTLNANQTLVSSNVGFTLDSNKDYLVIFDISDGANGFDFVAPASAPNVPTGATTYVAVAGSNSTSTKDFGTWESVQNLTFFVSLIEDVDAVIGPDTLATLPITAERVAETCHLLLFEEDVGTIVLNQDLNAFCSNDGGVTWTELVLGDEGKFSGNKRLLSGTALFESSGNSMNYKIERTKDLNLEGVGFEWN